ncbi:uncharacterized protein [Periplaneta americana]|uniref:uncharacterized protein n=1 Tax=Periplaneta americana TaxID=6978 RepID=UPI0037E89732
MAYSCEIVMKIPRIKTPFCGVGSLRGVTLGAGFLYLIISIAGAAAGFSYLISGSSFYEGNYMVSLFGISCFLWIIINLLLLYGAMLKQYRFLVPWICWHVAFPIVAFAEMVWAAVWVKKLSPFHFYLIIPLEEVGVAILSCVVPFLCTVIYFWIVVYSFYSDLKEAEDQLAIAFSRRQYSPTAPTEYSVPIEVAHFHAEAPPRSLIYNEQTEVPSRQRSQRHSLSDLPSNRRPSHYNRQRNASSNQHLQQLHRNMRRRDQPVDTESRRSSHDYYSISDEMIY